MSAVSGISMAVVRRWFRLPRQRPLGSGDRLGTISDPGYDAVDRVTIGGLDSGHITDAMEVPGDVDATQSGVKIDETGRSLIDAVGRIELSDEFLDVNVRLVLPLPRRVAGSSHVRVKPVGGDAHSAVAASNWGAAAILRLGRMSSKESFTSQVSRTTPTVPSIPASHP